MKNGHYTDFKAQIESHFEPGGNRYSGPEDAWSRTRRDRQTGIPTGAAQPLNLDGEGRSQIAGAVGFETPAGTEKGARAMPRGKPSRNVLESSFRLDEWIVEPDLNTLSRGTETVRIEAKVMEVLVFLASRGSRLVTRQEIFDGVWGTEFICDNTLTHSISKLRKTLGDDARNPRFIETIHRRGYRMMVPVTSLEGRETADPGRASRYRILCGTRSVQLRQGLNLIGRAAEATVRVDSVWVSRHHACITVEGRNATLEDLDSRNATFLNGFKLTRPMPLTEGDTIYLGKLSNALRFITVGLASTDPVDDTTPGDAPQRV